MSYPTTATTLAFTRDPDGCWYADIAAYPGPRGDLQMVAGADTLLDILSEGHAHPRVHFQLDPQPTWAYLLLTHPGDVEGGGYYSLIPGETLLPAGMPVWLCDVTLFVFGFLPKRIYFTAFTDE